MPRQGTAILLHPAKRHQFQDRNLTPPGDKTRRLPHANGIGALFDSTVIYFTAGSSWLSFSSAADGSAAEVFSDNSVCKLPKEYFLH